MKTRNIKLFILLGVCICANAPHEEHKHNHGDHTHTHQHTTSHSNEPTSATVAISKNDKEEIEESQVDKELPWYWRREWMLLGAPIAVWGFAIAQIVGIHEKFDKEYFYAFSAFNTFASLFAMFQYLACASTHAKDYKGVAVKKYLNDELQNIHKHLGVALLWYLTDALASSGQILNTWDNFDTNKAKFHTISYVLMLFIAAFKPFLAIFSACPNMIFFV